MIKNKNKIKDSDGFIFKMNNHKSDKMDYIVANKEDLFAIYTLDGLVLEKLSNIIEVQKL